MQVQPEQTDVPPADEPDASAVDLRVATTTPAVVVRVAPRSSADADQLLHALAAATEHPVPIVLDLRRADVGTEQAAVQSTHEAAARLEVEWCVVSSRRRPVLSVVGAGSTPARFATSRDALQALLYARQGYGPGWARA
jgi:hypothetical protein